MTDGRTYKPQRTQRGRIEQDLILSRAETLHNARHAERRVVCWNCQRDALTELDSINGRETERS